MLAIERDGFMLAIKRDGFMLVIERVTVLCLS